MRKFKGKDDCIVSCLHKKKECEIYDVDDGRLLNERSYHEEV